MNWIYFYKVAGGTTLYSNAFRCRSFNEAVKYSRSICRVAGVFLVGVMPYSVVANHFPSVLNQK